MAAAEAAAPLGVGGRGHRRLREDQHQHQDAEEPPAPGGQVVGRVEPPGQQATEPPQFGRDLRRQRRRPGGAGRRPARCRSMARRAWIRWAEPSRIEVAGDGPMARAGRPSAGRRSRPRAAAASRPGASARSGRDPAGSGDRGRVGAARKSGVGPVGRASAGGVDSIRASKSVRPASTAGRAVARGPRPTPRAGRTAFAARDALGDLGDLEFAESEARKKPQRP